MKAGGVTHCNEGLLKIIEMIESFTNDYSISLSGTANDIYKLVLKINANNGEFVEVSYAEAVAWAHRGGFAFYTHHSEGDEHSGHVAAFTVPYFPLGTIANIGTKEWSGVRKINETINKTKSRKYYIYIPRNSKVPIM